MLLAIGKIGEIKVKKSILITLVFFLIRICFISMSHFLFTHRFESFEEMRVGVFGFPVHFVYQDLISSGLSDYMGGFPVRFGLTFDLLDADPIIQNFTFISLLVLFYLYR
jgi:hypothetical protein